MQARADVRKAEAKRMQDLAAVDGSTEQGYLRAAKHFTQLHDLKTVDTADYIAGPNGGKQP